MNIIISLMSLVMNVVLLIMLIKHNKYLKKELREIKNKKTNIEPIMTLSELKDSLSYPERAVRKY